MGWGLRPEALKGVAVEGTEGAGRVWRHLDFCVGQRGSAAKCLAALLSCARDYNAHRSGSVALSFPCWDEAAGGGVWHARVFGSEGILGTFAQRGEIRRLLSTGELTKFSRVGERRSAECSDWEGFGSVAGAGSREVWLPGQGDFLCAASACGLAVGREALVLSRFSGGRSEAAEAGSHGLSTAPLVPSFHR